MKKTNWLSNKELEILAEERQKYKVKCKCGHTCTILNPKGYQICSWCHKYVFKNPQLEFEYRMKEKINREKRSKNEI